MNKDYHVLDNYVKFDDIHIEVAKSKDVHLQTNKVLE